MTKETFIVANWKMNQTRESVTQFFSTLTHNKSQLNSNVWIAPQAIHLDQAMRETTNLPIKIGAQNCSAHDSGAYTGELSPLALKDLGADFVILGHSERREYFKESDQEINAKILKALEHGLSVVYCVGETEEERTSGQTEQIIASQLQEGLKALPVSSTQQLLIAYEPVWAIGTGKTATPEMANDVHLHIQKTLQAMNITEIIPILYGGSVKPENIEALMQQEAIFGALVGGASLTADPFSHLAKFAFLK